MIVSHGLKRRFLLLVYMETYLTVATIAQAVVYDFKISEYFSMMRRSPLESLDVRPASCSHTMRTLKARLYQTQITSDVRETALTTWRVFVFLCDNPIFLLNDPTSPIRRELVAWS